MLFWNIGAECISILRTGTGRTEYLLTAGYSEGNIYALGWRDGAYEIVVGVPARHIGWRYDEDTIAALLRIQWWDWSHEELRERLRDFDDVASFCAKYDPGVR